MATQLSASERRLITELCSRSAEWAPGAACTPEPEVALSGGYSNRAIVLAAGQQRWVLRIRRQDDTTSDFACELQSHAQGAATGIAPKLRFSDRKRGVMIMDYVQGPINENNVDAGSARDSGELIEVAALLRKIHELPARGSPVHSPDLLVQQRRHIDPESRLAQTLVSAHDPLLAASQLISRKRPHTPALCHNDLLAANRVRRCDSALLAVDWEYAAPGDPLFDVAVCASEMPAEHTATLLKHYLGRAPLPQERRHLHAQCLLYRCIEACWFEIHCPGTAAARGSSDKLAAFLAAAPDEQKT